MPAQENTATEKRDVYATVTSQIIAAIEKGVGDWRMPWHTSGRHAFSPINVTSRKAYRGINTICLWAAAQAKGYESGEWGTYNQWQERGAQVRKGEKSTTVVFWKFASGSGETQDGGEEQTVSGSRLLFTRGYAVFNAAQVDGYTPKADPEATQLDRIEQAERFFGGIGADLRHGGNQAFYSLGSDHIQMPPFQAFKDSVSYYSTLAHEHTHWTAPPDRCDRQLGKRFGDSAYAAEELIAELGAAFTCAHLGLSTEPREDHAQYIQSWLRVLKADKRAIFSAASKAQQAADFLVTRDGVAALGLRTGNNKSMSLQICAGMSVFVCDNLAFRGDLIALKRKHTSGLNLRQELTLSVLRFQEHFGRLTDEITDLKRHTLADVEAKALIHDVFTQGLMPVRFLPDVSKSYFEPTLKAFEPRNAWSLHNAFTGLAKEMPMSTRLPAIQAVGKLFGMSNEKPAGPLLITAG